MQQYLRQSPFQTDPGTCNQDRKQSFLNFLISVISSKLQAPEYSLKYRKLDLRFVIKAHFLFAFARPRPWHFNLSSTIFTSKLVRKSRPPH